ncbi:hypothetical protein N9383_05360 [Granulosicoccus sp.]|nr:hypothetical protein [Granulosicoccus sp.]
MRLSPARAQRKVSADTMVLLPINKQLRTAMSVFFINQYSQIGDDVQALCELR